MSHSFYTASRVDPPAPEVRRIVRLRTQADRWQDATLSEAIVATVVQVSLTVAAFAIAMLPSSDDAVEWWAAAVIAGVAASVTAGEWAAYLQATSTRAFVRGTTAVWYDAWWEARQHASGGLKTDQCGCQGTEADPAHGRANAGCRRTA